MAAYATAERQAQTAGPSMFDTGTAQNPVWRRENTAGLDSLLVQFADLVAERLAERLAGPPQDADEWFDTRGAAEYLGVHRDTIWRLAAERAVPSEQEGPGCKLFFRRSDLDAWRCSDRRHLRVVAGDRS